MPSTKLFALFVSVGSILVNVQAQIEGPRPTITVLNSSFPHVYPNMPTEDYSPAWQQYFQVTEQLPNITWSLPRNWAGNIPVQRADHPNDTLFFWAFENENGSFTAGANERLDEPWGIWLNGGPGSSSMLGLLLENGPIHVGNDYSISANNYSWDKLADYVWIDQPVGTGWATADSTGYVADEDQMSQDFFGFLENFVKVFPSLAKRPLYITGESYAGTYIPYIMKTYFGMTDPPANLVKVAIGDGLIGSRIVSEHLPTLTIIETYPQLIGYNENVYSYFKEQSHLCGYDLNLTYPQNGYFPTINVTTPTTRQHSFWFELFEHKPLFNKRAFLSGIASQDAHNKRSNLDSERKRDLSGRANGTIDGWYGCFLLNELMTYATNYSFPWTLKGFDGFAVYDIPDALYPQAPRDPSVFLQDNSTRSAIHAPTSKDWTNMIYPFGSVLRGTDPSVEPMTFLTELATNATQQNISIVIYSGNDDSILSHRGSEVVIQNTTFGGIQGFTRKPSTPWTDDMGNFAGIVHQERNWTYVLFAGAGHLVPSTKPAATFTFLREFVLGHNQTGLVTKSDKTVSIIGGESSSLVGDFLPGGAGIYYGSGMTQSTYIPPTATVAAWNSFIATAAPPSSNQSSRSFKASAPRIVGVLIFVTYWFF